MMDFPADRLDGSDVAQQASLAQRDVNQQAPLSISEVALDKTTQDMRFPSEELARFLARQPFAQDPHAPLLQGPQASASSSQPQPLSPHASDAPNPAQPPMASHPSQSPPSAAQGISMRVACLVGDLRRESQTVVSIDLVWFDGSFYPQSSCPLPRRARRAVDPYVFFCWGYCA